MNATPPVRTRLQYEQPVRLGQPLALRASIAHPMTSDHQVDSQGRRQPRNILTRFECHGPQGLLFAADLHSAVAANPSLEFWLRPTESMTLRLRWTGDQGFVHEAAHELIVTP